MKISCESCSAQYDLDENRIPPSGMSMKCPACLHTFQVHRPMAARPPTPPPAGDSELPAPRGWKPPELEETDDLLPTPKSSGAAGVFMNPALVAPPKPIAPPGPPPAPPAPNLSVVRPILADPDAELPLPIELRGPDIVDLPAPKDAQSHPLLHDETPDLLTPKRPGHGPGVGVDIDAPEIDDLTSQTDFGGPPALELDRPSGAVGDDVDAAVDADLPTPKEIDVVAPKVESDDLLTPKLQTPDLLTPKGPAAAAAAPSAVDTAEDRPLAPSAPAVAARTRAPRRGSRAPMALVGALVLLVAVGVSLGLFTSTGYFGANLFTGRRAQAEAQLMAARKLMADDTLASYRKASVGLKPLVEAEPNNLEAAGLEAQAHLGAARLGITAEVKAAEAIAGRLEVDPHAGDSPDAQKALAMRALVAGKLPDARARLGAVLSRAPSDATALVALGWLELQAGDLAAAQTAFGKAMAAEPGRAAALYGLGLAKERQGDGAGAEEQYARTLVRSPHHFGAAVGAARTVSGKRRGTGTEGAEAAVKTLIDQQASSVGPREVADAWATLGLFAAGAGRREEAEDRFKRALGLDPDSATARVALARVQCDRGRPLLAQEPLRKLLAAQPTNLDARLALVRALAEGNAVTEAGTTLAPSVQSPPKDPPRAARVAYWQGRLALAAAKPDKEQALKFFKAAAAADPKMIEAYLSQSSLLAQLGRSDDAMDVLKEAEAQAADDPALMTELGEAYLGINKAVEAEARFRAALAKSPDRHASRMDLGLALEQQGKLDDAKVEYLAVDKVAPAFPGLAERRARLAVKQGDKEAAWTLFLTALMQGVPTHSLRLAAGDLALDLGKIDDGRKLAEEVLKEDDRSAGAHLLLARAQLALGRPEEALPEARRAATLSDMPEAHLACGRALELLGKLDQAVSEYQVARRPPVESEATLGRARILVRMGATRDALAELNGLIRDNKLRPQALLLSGDAYSDLQMAEKARHAYEDAVKYGPQLAEAAFKFGRSLHDAGRRKPAIEMLERALKLGGDQAPWSAEAHLLLGDAHREARENADAVAAYRRYLELAPPDAPARVEVDRHISILGGGK